MLTAVVLPLCVLAGAAEYANAEEVRWRVSDQEDTALLVMADSNASDHFGSPLFQCSKASGMATAEGDTTDDLRSTVAALILHDKALTVNLMPGDTSAQQADVYYSNMTGWRYRFRFSVTGAAFEQLKRTGSFQFKIDDANIRSEFKAGLANIENSRNSANGHRNERDRYSN